VSRLQGIDRKSPVRWLTRRIPPRVLLTAIAVAAGVTVLLWLLMRGAAPLFESIDHWTADLRTAFFTYRLPTQHPRLAIISIDDDAIAEAQRNSATKYRSPVDRGLLSHLIDVLDSLQPSAIGLDIIVDQPTEPEKDAAFLRTVQRAKTPIVFARLDFARGKAEGSDAQRAYHSQFLETSGRASGYVTVRTEADGVVRSQPSAGSGQPASFAQEIAKLGGWTPDSAHNSVLTKPSDRIAWLQTPNDNSATFLEIPAGTVVAKPEELRPEERNLLATLKNRLIVVGVRFQDRTDRHRTPLNKAGEDLMLGSEINANVIAQLIDGRSYRELTTPAVLGVSFLAALIGFPLAWRFSRSGWLVGSLPLAVYIVVGALLFWTSKLILPFVAPALAWAVGVYAGRLQGWQHSRRANLVARETSK
jgi:adenylate cyclase